MTLLRSLRSRLLLGSLLWTAGLLGLTHMLFIFALKYIPQFRNVHVTIYLHAFIVLALLSMAAGVFIVRGGVTPVSALRERMSAVREGRIGRVDGAYPSEVQPLVDDLNHLLAAREEAVRRAVARAGDLAHGLKTPLAVLAHDAGRADAAGQAEVAASIREEVERMRRQVEVALAHARAAGSGARLGARASVAASAEALARTLLRIQRNREVAIDVEVPPEQFVRCEREDLDEMIGNLLDNASKWARSRVRVRSAAEGASVLILVDDDGEGLDDSMCSAVLQRGVRADQSAPGSGLGLAIVRDIAEIYGGTITLRRSEMGGLRAELRLPAA